MSPGREYSKKKKRKKERNPRNALQSSGAPLIPRASPSGSPAPPGAKPHTPGPRERISAARPPRRPGNTTVRPSVQTGAASRRTLRSAFLLRKKARSFLPRERGAHSTWPLPGTSKAVAGTRPREEGSLRSGAQAAASAPARRSRETQGKKVKCTLHGNEGKRAGVDLQEAPSLDKHEVFQRNYSLSWRTQGSAQGRAGKHWDRRWTFQGDERSVDPGEQEQASHWKRSCPRGLEGPERQVEGRALCKEETAVPRAPDSAGEGRMAASLCSAHGGAIPVFISEGSCPVPLVIPFAGGHLSD
ncbi:serine/arginine repetitive matrix protein 3-like [Phyllostomus hastatus]|uniref:serine/arginine repetitive matrix protein 3-like n=1 Tax=Phyllostomus hastatus TaxID=9423 RepID=UPI001E67EADD|nr:serine/arginine repetitive matrix protein 3-like [Phyllostomus hastatus]